MERVRLYDFHESGNCYKVRLLLRHLDIDVDIVPVDILKGETRNADFARLNPNQRVPVVEFADGRRLAESNAILCYLASGTEYLPDDDWDRAKVLEWLFFEQYSHEPNIAVVRFWRFAGLLEIRQSVLTEKVDAGYKALDVMEEHLSTRPYFVANRFTIADIALYAYTHVAHEGGFELTRYPAIRDWIERVAGRPGHIAIDDDATGRPE